MHDDPAERDRALVTGIRRPFGVGGRRFYASPPGQPRVRRATDVVVLAATLFAIAGLVAAQPPGTFERALVRFLASFPGWLDPVWGFCIGILIAWLGVLLVTPLVFRRPRITLEALLAVALAVLLGLVSTRLATGHWAGFESAAGVSETLRFPSVRIALAAAVVAVANAHLAHAPRGLGRGLLMLGAAGAVLEGATSVSGTVAALLVGLAAGAAVRLLLGTSAGRPTIDYVAAALADFGVSAEGLTAAERQSAGVFLAHGTGPAGEALEVKVYGRDAYDNQLLAKLWRTLWYRDGGLSVGLSRAYPAEHEAFLTMLARSAGVPTGTVVTAGVTAAGDSLLVLRVSGRSLAELDGAEIGDDLLRHAWDAVARLGAARIRHAHLAPATVRIADGAVVLTDFERGSLAIDPDGPMIDRAQLLVTTATAVGADRAIAAAVAGLGRDQVAVLLPYLEQAAFGRSLRQAVKMAALDVEALRASTAEAIASPNPEPVQLRRVTWATAAQTALLVFAAGAVLSFVGGIDLEQLAHDMRDAAWGWIIAGVIVAQLPRLTQAVATLGSVPADLPFGPVYVLQLATSYLNLALPSSIARMAVDIRFFQMVGVSPAVAVTSGAIDSFVSNVMQVIILALLLLFSEATLSLHLSAPSTPGAKHLLVLLAVIGVAALAFVALSSGRRLRVRAREQAAHWWPQIQNAFASLRRSRKLAQLLLGSLATEILFAIALGLFARGLGYPLSLAQLLVVNTSVSLFSSLIPVPGGIGVVEGGLTVGLTASGMPESAAFATAILTRIASFYLPPIWGWFALQWLRRNRYL